MTIAIEYEESFFLRRAALAQTDCGQYVSLIFLDPMLLFPRNDDIPSRNDLPFCYFEADDDDAYESVLGYFSDDDTCSEAAEISILAIVVLLLLPIVAVVDKRGTGIIYSFF